METEIIEIKCDFCGELFIPKRRWAKFCSEKCRNNYHNDRKYMEKGEIPSIKCPYCTTSLPSMLEKLGESHYLCNVCAKEFSQ